MCRCVLSYILESVSAGDRLPMGSWRTAQREVLHTVPRHIYSSVVHVMGCPRAAEGAAQAWRLTVFCGPHISATAGLIHTNSTLIEVCPCGGVCCPIYSSVSGGPCITDALLGIIHYRSPTGMGSSWNTISLLTLLVGAEIVMNICVIGPYSAVIHYWFPASRMKLVVWFCISTSIFCRFSEKVFPIFKFQDSTYQGVPKQKS